MNTVPRYIPSEYFEDEDTYCKNNCKGFEFDNSDFSEEEFGIPIKGCVIPKENVENKTSNATNSIQGAYLIYIKSICICYLYFIFCL